MKNTVAKALRGLRVDPLVQRARTHVKHALKLLACLQPVAGRLLQALLNLLKHLEPVVLVEQVYTELEDVEDH